MGSANTTVFEPIPWDFDVDETHFWVHYGFVIFGGVFAVISFLVQSREPATYGKHEVDSKKYKQVAASGNREQNPCVQLSEVEDEIEAENEAKGKVQQKGFYIHQRLGHFLSDGPPGCIVFPLVFFLYGNVMDAVNLVFLCLFMAHYIHRGLIHPLIMKYSKTHVPLWITLGGIFPNLIFSFVNADWIGSAKYSSNYYYDPRFILGVILFVSGYIMNRWADFKLRNLRTKSGGSGYYIPYGGLFELVSCPNYLGELLEWMGWALATWSMAGLLWWLFGCSTFIPRSRDNHRWYKKKFDSYPDNRKALIPFIY